MAELLSDRTAPTQPGTLPDDVPAALSPSALCRRLLDGEIEAVAWGHMELMAAFQWRLPLRFKYVVDASWRRWGERLCGYTVRSPSVLAEEDPARVVVVALYHATPVLADIAAFAARHGGLACIPFATLEAMAEATLEETPGGMATESAALLASLAANPGPWPELPSLWRRLACPLVPRAEDRRLAMLRRLCESARAAIPAAPSPVPRRVCLLIDHLYTGGAERQICNLAVGLKALGWDPVLLSMTPQPAQAAHYRALLDRHGIPCRVAGTPVPPSSPDFVAALVGALPAEALAVLWLLPPEAVAKTAAVLLHLQSEPPELLVGYLDWANMAGGLAAVLAGTPRVLLSGRNLAPPHFPHFFAPWAAAMREVYRLVLGFPGVTLSNNSAAGAASYAAWLGVDPAGVAVVPNGLTEEFASLPPPRASRNPARDRETPGPLVLGVFRLAPEKRPFLFLDILDRLRRERPDLRAVVCGGGPLEGAVRAAIRERGLDGHVMLMGAVTDVAAMMRKATILLHVAEHEGMPNVLLEAQAAGLPMVCTDAGGAAEVVSDPQRPFLHAVDDVEGIASSCRRLLDDPALRLEIGRAARRAVRRSFSIRRLAGRTLRAAGLRSAPLRPSPAE